MVPFTKKRGTMMRSLFKPPAIAATSGFADKYNIDSECEWPTRMGGFLVKDCQLPIKHLETVMIDDQEYDIVTVPIGTVLYHGTKEPNIKYESLNSWSKRAVTWFATTFDHTMTLGPMKVHEFTIKNTLTLLFVRNMKRKYNISSGFSFVRPLVVIKQQIIEKTTGRIHIDGYIGCNECEIGIFHESLNKLNYPSTIKNVPYIE